jgi:hypothetical protein
MNPSCKRTFFVSVGVLCLWAVVGPTPLAAQDDPAMKDYLSSLRALAAAVEAGRCPDAAKDGPGVVADERFANVNQDGRVWILSSIVRCALEVGNERLAFDMVGKLVPMSTNDGPRHLRLHLALNLAEAEEAIVTLRAWSQVSPAGISRIGLSDVWRLLQEADKLEGGDRGLEVHEILSTVNYRSPQALSMDLDELRTDHARRLLLKGRAVEARRRIESLVSVEAHIRMAVDQAFDPIQAADRLDFTSLTATEIARAIAEAKDHPRLLQARYRIVQAYRRAGRANDALSAADAAIASIASEPSQFDDVKEYVNWLHNERAYALYELGRNEDGRAAMRAAIAAGEDGSSNVSQVINFANLLADEGDTDQALATLKLLGDASDYGRMWAEAVRACAAAQTDDTAMLDNALAYLRENESKNVAALQRSLLCANKGDEAAALYARRLADPSRQTEALLALQNWQKDPSNLPFRNEIYRRLDEIRARPDVQAAIAAVGRVLDLPLIRAYWGNL